MPNRESREPQIQIETKEGKPDIKKEKISPREIGRLKGEIRRMEKEYEKILAILRREVMSRETRQEIEGKYPELLKEVMKEKPIDVEPIDVEREILYKRMRKLDEELRNRKEKIERAEIELKK